MNNEKKELIATLNAMSEICERLAQKGAGENFKETAKVTKRIATLEKDGYSEDTILTILKIEGYLTSEQLVSLLNM